MYFALNLGFSQLVALVQFEGHLGVRLELEREELEEGPEVKLEEEPDHRKQEAPECSVLVRADCYTEDY